MRKKALVLVALLFATLNVMADDAWKTTYKEIESRIVAPTFKNKTYSWKER